jgi:predicted NBD/HSP70 family sugar kinase
MKKVICFDIGGTAVKYGIISEGKILEESKFPTEPSRGAANLLARMEKIIEEKKLVHNLCGIAISTAGIVDTERGAIIYALPKITGYTGTDLKAYFAKNSSLACEVENDVNCAGLAEQSYGSAKGSKLTVCIAVGSGIGGAVLLDGKILHGAGNCAGEVGFLHLKGGSLEECASVQALINRVASLKNMAAEELDGEKIFALAKAGDADAKQAIAEIAAFLGEGIADIACVLNPETVVLGGGIMNQSEYLQPLIEKALQKYLLPVIYEKLKLKFAAFGNSAGLVGAYENFRQRQLV